MNRFVNHSSMSVVGYTTPWSVTVGHNINVHLSTDGPVDAVSICRLDTETVEYLNWQVQSTSHPPAHRMFAQGSYLKVRSDELKKAGRIRGLSFELFLTRNIDTRTICQLGDIILSVVGRTISLSIGAQSYEVDANVPLQTWLTICLEEENSSTNVSICSSDRLSPHNNQLRIDGAVLNLSGGDLYLGTSEALNSPTLNCKFATITLDSEEGLIAWHFPTRHTTEPILSLGGAASLSLEVVNQPTFCVISARWDGSSFDPRLVPSHFDALHCHDDDMEGLCWPVSYTLNVPESAQPGIYAFQFESQGKREQIVFFIVSSKPKSPLVFVVPTATYLAYADEFLPKHLYEWKCDDRGHRLAVDNNFKSLYDYHSDLSGVSICSYKRPKATIRADYQYPICGCPHNLPVDLHLLRFCHGHGIHMDLITDHDLHERGPDALRGYQGVVTGSHPEYLSIEMENTYREFVAEGGSLAYLGGNGFAATVAFKDDMMELRRSPLEEGRTWDGMVAQQALSITNEPGGNLRTRGRGEFSLVGVAISLMGFDGARPFTRTSESFEQAYTWLFEGVDNDTFGEGGIVLGAAAGYEVDATNSRLGTSHDTVVLARATGFPASFTHDSTRWYEGGERELADSRCAEMAIRYLASGGLIFSASSVAWCGALPHKNRINDVGRITLNLLNYISTSNRN